MSVDRHSRPGFVVSDARHDSLQRHTFLGEKRNVCMAKDMSSKVFLMVQGAQQTVNIRNIKRIAVPLCGDEIF